MSAFAESVVEEAALAWLGALGYTVHNGPDIACGEPGAERREPAYRDVVLERRFRFSTIENLSGRLGVAGRPTSR